MIYLTKGQKLFGNEGMVVYDQTGYYEDNAPIVCAMVFAPEDSVCRYEAKFVAYGDTVYSITDESVLMEQVNAIDPNSLFGKTSVDIKEDKKIEEIETVDQSEAKEVKDEEKEEPELDPEPIPEKEPVPVPESEPILEPEPTPTPEPEVIPAPVPEVPTEVVPEIVPNIVPIPETPTEQVVRLFNKKTKRKIT